MQSLRRTVARARIEDDVPGWGDINEETKEIMIGDEVLEPVRWDDRLTRNERFEFTRELLAHTGAVIFKPTQLNQAGQMAFDRWIVMASMDGDHLRHVRTVVDGTWITEAELTAAVIRGDAFHAVTRRLLGPVTEEERKLLEQGTVLQTVRDEEQTQDEKDIEAQETQAKFVAQVEKDKAAAAVEPGIPGAQAVVNSEAATPNQAILKKISELAHKLRPG